MSKRGKTLKMQRSMKDIVNAEPKSHGRDPEQYRFYEAFVKISQFWSIFWKLQDHRHGSRGRGCKCWVPCTQSHDKVAYLSDIDSVPSVKFGLVQQFQRFTVVAMASYSCFFGPCKFVNVFVVLWNWINIFIAFCGFVTKEFGWVHSNECNLASTKMGKHHIKQSHSLSTSSKK